MKDWNKKSPRQGGKDGRDVFLLDVDPKGPSWASLIWQITVQSVRLSLFSCLFRYASFFACYCLKRRKKNSRVNTINFPGYSREWFVTDVFEHQSPLCLLPFESGSTSEGWNIERKRKPSCSWSNRSFCVVFLFVWQRACFVVVLTKRKCV